MGMIFGKVSEETPKFALLKEKAAYEVRAYQPKLIAEVTSAYTDAGRSSH